MKEFRGVVSLQVESLLDALRIQKEHRCRQIIGDAENRSKQLLTESRQKLRDRFREAINEERRRRSEALTEADRQIETAERRKVQARYNRLLREAWPELIGELERRWSIPEERRAWCEAIVEEASSTLAHESWTFEFPESWTTEDTGWLMKTFESRGLPRPDCVTSADIEAGARIRLGSACLDGTIEGVLARRSSVEARLLATLERNSGEESV